MDTTSKLPPLAYSSRGVIHGVRNICDTGILGGGRYAAEETDKRTDRQPDIQTKKQMDSAIALRRELNK